MRLLPILALALLIPPAFGQQSTNSNTNTGGRGAGITAGSFWFYQAFPNVTLTGGVANTETAMFDVPIPANAMGPVGILRLTVGWTYNNTANGKTLRHRFSNTANSLAGVSILTFGGANFTVTQGQAIVRNANATGTQSALVSGGPNNYFPTTITIVPMTVDTTQITHLTVTGSIATTTDTITLTSITVEALHP